MAASASSSSSSAAEAKEGANGGAHGALRSVRYAHFELQGARPQMEDQFLVVEDIVENKNFYGVFDGHGGQNAAIFCREHMGERVAAQLRADAARDPGEALAAAYEETDEAFIKQADKDTSGTTAVTCLLDRATGELWVANVGDSRAVLVGKDGVVALTRDHKASREDEVRRVRDAGGFVIFNRVMGELAITRAIGDAEYKVEKARFVIATPEVERRLVQRDDLFVLMACDGVFDVLNNEEAADYCRALFEKGNSAEEVVKALVTHCVKDLESRDNVTALIIKWE